MSLPAIFLSRGRCCQKTNTLPIQHKWLPAEEGRSRAEVKLCRPERLAACGETIQRPSSTPPCVADDNSAGPPGHTCSDGVTPGMRHQIVVGTFGHFKRFLPTSRCFRNLCVPSCGPYILPDPQFFTFLIKFYRLQRFQQAGMRTPSVPRFTPGPMVRRAFDGRIANRLRLSRRFTEPRQNILRAQSVRKE